MFGIYLGKYFLIKEKETWVKIWPWISTNGPSNNWAQGSLGAWLTVVCRDKPCFAIFKGWYTLGDKLQQHVAATRHSDKLLHVYWKILWKSLSLQQNFVAATCCKKIKSDRICATCHSDKIPLQRQRFSPNFSSSHEAICRLVCTNLEGLVWLYRPMDSWCSMIMSKQ